MNKKELREQLGADSVAQITTILRESGRDCQTTEISDQDATFVTSVYSLVKQGVSVIDAIAAVQSGGNLELIDSNKEHYLALASQLKNKLITDGKEFWVAYYECFPDAVNSPEVLESLDVKEARAHASARIIQVASSQNMKQDKEFFLSAIRQQISPLHKAQVEAPPQEIAA